MVEKPLQCPSLLRVKKEREERASFSDSNVSNDRQKDIFGSFYLRFKNFGGKKRREKFGERWSGVVVGNF